MKKVTPNNFFLIVLLTSVIFYCALIIFYNRDQITSLVVTETPVVTADIANTRTLTGILKKIIPPSADEIEYKYVLELDKKFQTMDDSLLIGGSGLAPKTIVVTLSSKVSDAELKKLLNKHISLTGIVGWGYAETKYINIDSFNLIK